MSDLCDKFEDRLRELKDANRPLTIADFANLGLTGNGIAECARQFESRGIVEIITIHKTSRDSGGVDQVVIRITDQGKEDLSTP